MPDAMIQRVTRRHTVTVYRQVMGQGSQMGNTYAYGPEDPSRTLRCTVIPRASTTNVLLQGRWATITHDIAFAEDPQIDERNRLVWIEGTNTAFRVLAPALNEHGQNRLWNVIAEAMSLDQVTKRIE